MIKLTSTGFLEYVTSPENLDNMGKATIDIKGLISNAELLEILQGIQSKSSTSKEWKVQSTKQ